MVSRIAKSFGKPPIQRRVIWDQIIIFASKSKYYTIMESKEYFEKVMQEFNQKRNGRSLRKYCSDEGIDYKWVLEFKKNYPPKPEKL